MEFQSVNKLLEKSFQVNWDRAALSNYQGVTLSYRDVARRIAKLHIAFEQCGLERGDKVAICSRNQANWGVSFMAAITYGAVAVPILHEFKPSNIEHIVNHSDSKILFAGSAPQSKPDEEEILTSRVIPTGRVGTTEDIAKAVLWLCSDDAKHITGVNLSVDGGVHLN